MDADPIGLDGVRLAPVDDVPSRSDLVGRTLRDAIVAGRLRPGATLVERRLAEQLGVSKTPVREALIRLARGGLVEILPNRRAVVATLDLPALVAVYEVRVQLEPWAVGRSTAAAPAEVHAAAAEALERGADAIARADRVALSLANRAFHRALYARCGNEIVLDVLDNLQDRVALGTVSLLWTRHPTWEAEAAEHRAVLEAVGEGDGALAARLVHDHIAASLERLRGDQGADAADAAPSPPAAR
ncbi:GntR family transcriptional regulator [Conexibacter arvalis]|uniref:DNA-binding GntR family transcriptional regulator n=1 Tax=Conexibacter arvalis TaxID=912552 RepID=A0A840IH73_9ACTN|nr:GntR family transcriptional regulator [Conexibacter arvalis]MBB4664272.1 DNA-binding GntR family transcriptional regulator [Conexibacter arvalis]